jgi:hypothetical protein
MTRPLVAEREWYCVLMLPLRRLTRFEAMLHAVGR